MGRAVPPQAPWPPPTRHVKSGRPPTPDRLRTNTQTLAVPESAWFDEPPAAPTKLRKAQKESWAAFWSSELARLVQPQDLPALRRLWRWYDQQDRALGNMPARRSIEVRCRYSADPEDYEWVTIKIPGHLGIGSQDQVVVHPSARWAAQAEDKIIQLEDRFGLSPTSRLKLGIDYATAGLSLADLNDRIAAAAAAEDDPR